MEKQKDNFQKLLEVTANAKNALIEKWKKDNGQFIDANKLTSEGQLSDPIALVGLLLILVAMRSESVVISDADRQAIAEIADKTMIKMSEWTKDGFLPTPLVDAEQAKEVFDGTTAYLDSITWVMSSSILVRYAEHNGLATFAEETIEIAKELLAKSFVTLLKGQRDDGTWGFTTGKSASRSLYHTYSASASLADFFDYICGEIEEVEDNNENTERIKYVDKEILKFLAEKLGIDPMEAAEKARQKLAKWLLTDALPLLPKLASCRFNMTEEEHKRLGIWEHEPIKKLKDDTVNYFNLYYTYYLIDLMVLTGTDKVYEDLVKSPTSPEFTELVDSYKNIISDFDFRFYFKEGSENANDFWRSYVEQAINISRNQYICASRTGNAFWDGSSSELPVELRSEDEDVNDAVDTLMDRVQLTDPAVVPMALRVNALYAYYICDQSDVAVDRLFNDICNNISTEDKGKKIKHLWDTIGYDLMITERAIEALVDYYDYCRKNHLDQKTASVADTAVEAQASTEPAKKSDFELAFEVKVAEYLRSQQGRTLLAEICGSNPPAAELTAKPGGSVVQDQIAVLEAMMEDAEAYTNASGDSDNDLEVRAAYTQRLFGMLATNAINAQIAKSGKDCDEVNKSIKDLFAYICDNAGKSGDLAFMLKKLQAKQ